MPRTQNLELRTIFTDTHCHIHDLEFFPDGGAEVYKQAREENIHRMICVGTDTKSSHQAVQFAAEHERAFAAVGIHPHDALKEGKKFEQLQTLAQDELLRTQNLERRTLVAIGEIGLDYHYMNSPREVQIELLEKQIDFALKLGLPVSFHVREGFDDFWPIFDNFQGVRGVLHSFTDTKTTLERALERGLYIGVNGIATFAHDRDEVTQAIPLEKILLETDSPFLTPAPLRGKINIPGNVRYVASYVAELRGITVEELSRRTEESTSRLFF